jgi:voltage-gated potassium channel
MNFLVTNKQVFHYQRFRRIVVALVTVAAFLGVMVIPFESGQPGATIHTPFDALWWAMSTITTVGYGDRVPVTIPGRTIGILLQVVGGLLFGSVVGTFTVYLNRARDEYYWQRMFERVDRLSGEVSDLHKQMSYLIKDKGDKKETDEPG